MVGFTNESFSAKSSDGAYSVAVTGGYVSNLGITYASNTLSIASADGTALSVTNPGFVIMQSKSSPGLLKKYTITENQGFIDATGVSEIPNNLFGLTSGAAITNPMPFFGYAVTNDAEDAIAFMISRIPHATTSPPSANIGAPDDAVADAQGAFFSFENIDETLYDGNPCFCVGTFRMTMDASDDWTVTALTAADGIGQFHEQTLFTIPAGQWGATTGTWGRPNGGTVPIFANYYQASYQINRSGLCSIQYNFDGDGGTDGAGAVIAQFIVPFDSLGTNSFGGSIIVQAGAVNHINHIQIDDNDNAFWITEYNTSQTPRNWDIFTNGNRTIRGGFQYPIKPQL